MLKLLVPKFRSLYNSTFGISKDYGKITTLATRRQMNYNIYIGT